MPTKYNIEHYRGDAYSQEIKFKTDLGNPEDLTGQTIIAQIRESTDLDAVKLLDFSVGREDTNGAITLSLTGSQTQSLEAGTYVYDVQVGTETRLYGNFKLIGDVSR